MLRKTAFGGGFCQVFCLSLCRISGSRGIRVLRPLRDLTALRTGALIGNLRKSVYPDSGKYYFGTIWFVKFCCCVFVVVVKVGVILLFLREICSLLAVWGTFVLLG